MQPKPQPVKQQAKPLKDGDVLSSAPAIRRPARDVKRPRAEELLDAAQEDAQRWRAQAMRMEQELHSARSAAHSERHDIVMQLRGARARPAGADFQVSGGHQDVAALIRQRDSALDQLLRTKAALAAAQAAAAAKRSQAKLDASSQEAVLHKGIQLRKEQKARAAAESRAADLEQKVQDLECENRRIIAGRKEVRQQYEAALEALGETDIELSASKASNEQAEQLITQLRTQLKEATAAKSWAEQYNVQLVSQLEAAKTAKDGQMGAELHEARQACQVAQAAAEKEGQRAADLDASKAALVQQLDNLQKVNKVQNILSCASCSENHHSVHLDT